MSAGNYETPIPRSGIRELDTIAFSIDTLASRVRNTEQTRRRMLTDLSHELKTPISAINVSLEALEDGMLPPDATTWDSLRRQTSRLSRLVGDIRDVSAFEEGFAASGTTLELGRVLDARADVDVERFEQVLENLLRNAHQHARGGKVTVSMQTTGEDVEVGVIDDGVGIADDEMPLLFERFYRGDAHARHDQGEGTGIGLSISRSLMRALGETCERPARARGTARRSSRHCPWRDRVNVDVFIFINSSSFLVG